MLIRKAFDDGLTDRKRGRLKDQARANLKACAMPHCNNQPARDQDANNLGICFACALPIADYFARLGEVPALTEAKLKRQLRDRAEEEHRFQQAEARAFTQGWVYYVQIGDRIKIGYASDVAARLRAYPPEHKLLAVHPGTRTLEADMHQQFRGSRAAGREWYYPHPDLLAHIDQVVAQFGKPGQRGLSRLTVGGKHHG